MNNVAPVLKPSDDRTGILPIVAGRWSSRAINPSLPVDPEVMKRLFEAARWAPSAMNNQPWRFLEFGPEDSESLGKARGALTAGNSWALSAPRLLFILCRSDRPGSGKPNPRAQYEAGMAAIQMALQAAEEGLVFHQMAGFSAEKVQQDFSVPENFSIITAAAVGWPGGPEQLSEQQQIQETDIRTRKPLSSLVFSHGAVPAE